MDRPFWRVRTDGPGNTDDPLQALIGSGVSKVSEQMNMEMLVQQLTACLDELDRIGAHIPAAHVDAAINALMRRHEPMRYPPETD